VNGDVHHSTVPEDDPGIRDQGVHDDPTHDVLKDQSDDPIQLHDLQKGYREDEEAESAVASWVDQAQR